MQHIGLKSLTLAALVCILTTTTRAQQVPIPYVPAVGTVLND